MENSKRNQAQGAGGVNDRNKSKRIREKMDPADRAKQFMPFDALKGFREALEEKEREIGSIEKMEYL